jgi:hypothetical protein
VDLLWQGPRMFSLGRIPSTIPSYNGVSLISSRKFLYDYPRGRSSLAFVGSGQVDGVLIEKISGDTHLAHQLRNEGTMWYWHASVGHRLHEVVAGEMMVRFEERHESIPRLNDAMSPVDAELLSRLRVRHHHLAFPFDFSRPDFP